MSEIKDYKHYATVGDLLDFIEKHKIPRDSKILLQRVEDQYFEGIDISGITGALPDGTIGKLPEGSKSTPWKVFKKEGDQYHTALKFNENLAAGKFKAKDLKPYTEEMLDELKDQYIVAWSPVKYPGDDHLYLDAHY